MIGMIHPKDHLTLSPHIWRSVLHMLCLKFACHRQAGPGNAQMDTHEVSTCICCICFDILSQETVQFQREFVLIFLMLPTGSCNFKELLCGLGLLDFVVHLQWGKITSSRMHQIPKGHGRKKYAHIHTDIYELVSHKYVHVYTCCLWTESLTEECYPFL